ncbi:YkgJ family cysteine cluster protein [Tahibacter amnicola]|uniref:YkgJ family cysteine cluster protein n=1 Tax=Tahibacter amnicola TaxID=2976241 RepID=A0ABY6BEG6_9GAMM|nr:YkgJ family cysteine cluster protein [Tahibacter amnicola]UXI68139.1 YkgJ family cysteine cluster protein [Tahibacter amnicola]
MQHPCLTCGACCARFRVAFHWSESTLYSPDGMDVRLTEKLDPHRLCMRGTDGPASHCIALAGTVGVDARCTQYAHRPSPCRELLPAWENGEPSPQCDKARAHYGLPPLTPETWR